jgi:hypothetical protein
VNNKQCKQGDGLHPLLAHIKKGVDTMKKFEELIFLISHDHIAMDNGKLTLMGTYNNGINNSCGYYYTNESVRRIVNTNKDLTIKQLIRGYVRERNKVLNGLDEYSLNNLLHEVVFKLTSKTCNSDTFEKLRLLQLKKMRIKDDPKRNQLVNNLFFRYAERYRLDEEYCTNEVKGIENSISQKEFLHNRNQLNMIEMILDRVNYLHLIK